MGICGEKQQCIINPIYVGDDYDLLSVCGVAKVFIKAG
jgi:hypothetical protein